MEYEYSFKVTNIKEYIDYCKSNNYTFMGKFKQTRTIYRNKNKTIARITIEEGKKIEKKLDFKEDKITNNDLNIRKESVPLTFEDDDAIKSILNFLEYKQDNTLIRIRYVYKKDNVKFEIDEYEKPNKNYVVAVEGEKTAVDKIYKDLNNLYKI